MASATKVIGLHNLCSCAIIQGSTSLARVGLPCGTFLGSLQPIFKREKHYDPRFRKLRAQKVIRFELPDYEKWKREASMSFDEMRSKMKKEGKLPPRTFQETNITIASSGGYFEAYVPPEGDGRASIVSGEGVKQKYHSLEKKGKSLMAVRKIKKWDDTFDVKSFPQQALDIYIEAHNLLENVTKNEDRLHELVTEKAYPEMTWRLDKMSYRWQFIESLEPPRVVHARVENMFSKDNEYGQVTVRFHSKQVLALYDRFGRLALGSEKLQKDSLEYVVFENHLSDDYGKWRIHGKIIPDWLPPRQHVLRTMKKPSFDPIPDDDEADGKDKNAADEEDDEPVTMKDAGSSVPLATA